MSAVTDTMLEEAARFLSRLESGDPVLAGEAARQLDAWLCADPRHRVAWDELRETAQRLDRHAPALRSQLRPPPATRSWKRLAGPALAACLLLALIGVGGWEARARWVPVETRELATAIGEQGRFTLADGSEITLNTGSRVSVRLTRRQREVVLHHGEAFFAVSPDPDAPFRVRGQQVSVTVLGTRFSVLESRQQQVVTVESGRVRVAAPGQPEHMLTDRQEWLALPGRAPEVRTVDDLPRRLAWRNGQLIFHDQPLLDVLAEIQRYRQEPIRFQGSRELAAFRLSGTFRTGHTEDFFSTLPLASPARVRQEAGQFVID